MSRLNLSGCCGILLIQILLCYKSSVAENILSELEDELFVKHDNHTDRVTIYTESNFWGIPWSLTVTNCTEVPHLLYKKASSINTHGNCMILYGREECQGRHVRVEPGSDGHSHLSAVDFDDTLVSLEPCDLSNDSNNSTSLINPHSKSNSTEKESESKSRVRRNGSVLNQILGMGLGSSSIETDTNNESDSLDDRNDSEQQNDDGAIDISSFLQNLNLKSLMDKFTGNDESSNGNGWASHRSKRASNIPKGNQSNIEANQQQDTTPYSVPLQNVIY